MASSNSTTVGNGPSHAVNEGDLPIFAVEKVELKFSVASDFVAAQVSNNVIVLALQNGRIMRIDLENPGEIDGMYPIKSYTLRQSYVSTKII